MSTRDFPLRAPPESCCLSRSGSTGVDQLQHADDHHSRSGQQVGAARVYGLHVGDNVVLLGGSWPIVGCFSDADSILESQLVGDAATLMAAGRMSGFSRVLVRLDGPEAFERSGSGWLTTNSTLMVNPERQSDYALRTVHRASAFFTALTYARRCNPLTWNPQIRHLVGVLVSIGAHSGGSSASLDHCAVHDGGPHWSRVAGACLRVASESAARLLS